MAYKFVHSDAHPILSELGKFYKALDEAVERAKTALSYGAEKQAKLRDLTEPKEREDRADEIIERRTALTSAFLEARASFDQLYKAAADIQPELEDKRVKALFFALRDGTAEVPAGARWTVELFDHNVVCATKRLKQAVDTLGEFDWDCLHLLSAREASFLPMTHSSRLLDDLNTARSWLKGLPPLVQPGETAELSDSNRWLRWLFTSCLRDRGSAGGGWSAYLVRTERIPETWVATVVGWLERHGWKVRRADKALELKSPENFWSKPRPVARERIGFMRSQ